MRGSLGLGFSLRAVLQCRRVTLKVALIVRL